MLFLSFWNVCSFFCAIISIDKNVIWYFIILYIKEIHAHQCMQTLSMYMCLYTYIWIVSIVVFLVRGVCVCVKCIWPFMLFRLYSDTHSFFCLLRRGRRGSARAGKFWLSIMLNLDLIASFLFTNSFDES